MVGGAERNEQRRGISIKEYYGRSERWPKRLVGVVGARDGPLSENRERALYIIDRDFSRILSEL
jgi:hypothetical protein